MLKQSFWKRSETFNTEVENTSFWLEIINFKSSGKKGLCIFDFLSCMEMQFWSNVASKNINPESYEMLLAGRGKH